MKSGKQRRAELDTKKQARKDRRLRKMKTFLDLDRLEQPRAALPEPLVVSRNLAPDGSYSLPDFVSRGYYRDKPFSCEACGTREVWTATQQKWWYEVAKGGVWTTARLCRPCRRRKRERKNEARRVHLEGLERKKRKA